MAKLPMWKEHTNLNEAEKKWDEGAAHQKISIKGLKTLPKMVGITADTAKGLKWKSFKWIIGKDKKWKCIKHFLKHPIRYGWNYLKSILRSQSFKREGDFFLYGIKSKDDFLPLCKKEDALIVIGFSYCHKPLECPSGRFTPDCIADPDHFVCRQCFIGKSMNLLPEKKVIPLIIPTVHYIGEEIFKVVHEYPEKQVLFLITACEMTLNMFSDWGNMVGVKGVGVRLDGRICNTMKAFELSENGIKPGLTVVLDDTQKAILEWIKALHS